MSVAHITLSRAQLEQVFAEWTRRERTQPRASIDALRTAEAQRSDATIGLDRTEQFLGLVDDLFGDKRDPS